MIHTSLSPNSTPQDLITALSYLILPWKWPFLKNGHEIANFESEFENYFQKKTSVITFDSGRSALLAILKAADIKKGDEVLLQAYTCVVVPNAIKFCGATPVYIDIETDSFNIDSADLTKKITPKSRALIIQNTFGQVADYDRLLKIAKQHQLLVIEDCAHSLGAKYRGRPVGTLTDSAFFSFGRDKIISCVFGGAAATVNPDLAQKIRHFQASLKYPSHRRIISHLLHPLFFAFALPLYNSANLGQLIIRISQKLRLISKALQPEEKKGQKPPSHPARLPNALAHIARNQLRNLNTFNAHRRRLADFYHKNLSSTDLQLPKIREDKYENAFLRYTILDSRRREILEHARKQNIYLGDWYDSVIAPHDCDLTAVGYRLGSCPQAEKKATLSFNLPTHHKISLQKAQKIIDFLQNFPAQ